MESDPQKVGLDPAVVVQYLRLLGVPSQPPSLKALKELLSAQLTRIPFENVSKLYYKKRLGLTDLPPIQMYLDGAEKHRFGGTCYSNNFHFYCLLANLGYNAKLCAADMAIPDVHAVSMVSVDGAEYLADTGYAAPFLVPLSRDLKTDFIVALGRDRYVLKPQDRNGCSRLELHRGGVLKHGYLAKPAPREIGDFRRVIDSSFRADATFLNSILLARFYPGRSVVIHNLTLIESCGELCDLRPLPNLDAAIAAIHKYFEIPQQIVAEAIGGLRELQDAWGDPFLGGREA
ncbi:MAG: arylamine N-acetyltransferase [Candidatus Sulfotelmatobacter sp.]